MDFQKRWRRATAKVWANISPDNPHGIGITFSAMIQRLPPFMVEWDEEVQRAAFDRYVPNGLGYPDPRYADIIRCVRIGYCLASGSLDAMSPSERESLAALGFDGIKAPARPTTSPPPGDSFGVEFAFVYKGIKAGTRSASAWIASRGTTVVHRIDDAGATPAYSLPVPGRAALEVVDVDGSLYRPVLRPGTWEPATEADFVQACRGDDGWADDPFAPPAQKAPGGYPLSPRETGRAADAGAGRDEALGDRVARGAALLSIGGVVHVRTEAPFYSPAVEAGIPEGRVLLGWRMGDLASIDDTSPFARLAPGRDWTCGFATPRGLGRSESLAKFPPGAFAAASDLAASLAEALGLPYEAPEEPFAAHVDPMPFLEALVADLPFSPGCEVRIARVRASVSQGTVEAYEAAAKGVGSLARVGDGSVRRSLAFGRAAALAAAKGAGGAYETVADMEAAALSF